MSLVDIKYNLSLPELLDYKESLTAIQMLEEASHIDAQRNTGSPK